MVKNDNSLVSIVVPVYNVEKYIDECLGSITGQSYSNLEIIIIDDASTDNSGYIVDEWAKKDTRIVVIHKTLNEGLNMARKTGYDASNGKYITFVDSDDVIYKDNIKVSLSTMYETNADVVVYAFQEICDNDVIDECHINDKDCKIKQLSTKKQIVNYALFGDDNLPRIQYMTVWGKLYNRKTIAGVDWSISNYRVYEDNFWTPQALLKSNRVTLLSIPLIFYRRNLVYGAKGNNLGNRMTGNSIDGKPVGYVEYIEQLRKFYYKLVRDNGFDDRLDSRINQHLLISKTWRIDNLAKEHLLKSENNLEYIIEVLTEYIEAKNKHIENLNMDIVSLNQNLADLNININKLSSEYSELRSELEKYNGIRRSARLLAGNVKRKFIKKN